MDTTQHEAPGSNIGLIHRAANALPQQGSGWTDARVAALRGMWAEGLSASQAAKRLGGVTRNAVIGKVHRLGLMRRRQQSTARAFGVRAARVAVVKMNAARGHKISLDPPPRNLPTEPRTKNALAPMIRGGAPRTIMTIQAGECSFIADAPSREAALCGRDIVCGAYCADHARLCYTASRPRRHRGDPTAPTTKQAIRDQWAAHL